MNAWLVFGGAVLFRLVECIRKSMQIQGKFDLMAILKEFFVIS